MESTEKVYEVEVKDKTLVLRKKGELPAKVDFDDGVLLDIPNSVKPRHLQFWCKSTADGEAESCDVRLAKRTSSDTLTWSGSTSGG